MSASLFSYKSAGNCSCSNNDDNDQASDSISLPEPAAVVVVTPENSVTAAATDFTSSLVMQSIIVPCNKQGQVDKHIQVMSAHPDYLDPFLRTHNYILRGDGPLSYHCRNFIAIMVCCPLIQFPSNRLPCPHPQCLSLRFALQSLLHSAIPNLSALSSLTHTHTQSQSLQLDGDCTHTVTQSHKLVSRHPHITNYIVFSLFSLTHRLRPDITARTS